ncbi:hypothetical protein VPH35_048919 [Triticum aestivum]|uniref:Uncharacterized protein n=1 Tax=Triticum aestivum TaxID=4565 RepID=A0A077RUB9_WHEAT|nr:unnamed protein product [Triticum aestivum]
MAPSMSLAAKGLLPFGALPSSGVAQRSVSVTASLEHKTSDYKRKLLKLAPGGVGLPALLSAKKAFADDQGVFSSRMSYLSWLPPWPYCYCCWLLPRPLPLQCYIASLICTVCLSPIQLTYWGIFLVLLLHLAELPLGPQKVTFISHNPTTMPQGSVPHHPSF